MNVTRCQRGDQHRRLADKDSLGVDTVLDEKAVVLSDPQRRDAGIERRMADHRFAHWRRRMRGNAAKNCDRSDNQAERALLGIYVLKRLERFERIERVSAYF